MADLGHEREEEAEDWERWEPPACPEAGPHASGKAPRAGQPPFLRGLFPKALDTSVLIFSNQRPSLQVPAGQEECCSVASPTLWGSLLRRRGWRPQRLLEQVQGPGKSMIYNAGCPWERGLMPPPCCPVNPPLLFLSLDAVHMCVQTQGTCIPVYNSS